MTALSAKVGSSKLEAGRRESGVGCRKNGDGSQKSKSKAGAGLNDSLRVADSGLSHEISMIFHDLKA